MEAISWAFRPVLESIHPQEPQVLALRESIASTLTAALLPVRQYIAKAQAYETWLAVDPTAYVDALQVSNASTVRGCWPQPHCRVLHQANMCSPISKMGQNANNVRSTCCDQIMSMVCYTGALLLTCAVNSQAKSEELNLSEVQAEINKHQRELVAMQSALPASINLGFIALQLVKVGLQCC